MKQPIRLVMFGRQGAGKGTQCKHLSTYLGLIHFSTGDALRAAAKEKSSELGSELVSVLESGQLVNDDLMIRLVVDRLNTRDAIQEGYILDGFPRTVAQASGLRGAQLDGTIQGGEVDIAVELDVPIGEAISRMLERGRSDDTQEAIAKRLKAYDEETVPVLRWYAEQGKLVTVDGLGAEKVVTKRLITAIEERLELQVASFGSDGQPDEGR